MPTVAINLILPHVTPTEDFLVYIVESRTQGNEPYRVDLQMFNGNGKCHCADFDIGKKKKHAQLRHGAMPSEALECWHIKQARRYLAFEVINEAIKRREKLANKNKEASSVGHGVSRPVQETQSAITRISPSPKKCIDPKEATIESPEAESYPGEWGPEM